MMISTRMRPRLMGSAVLGAFALRSPFATAQQATPATLLPPSPPTQPPSGPGGADYAYDEVVVETSGAPDIHSASDAGYWLVEPAVPRPGATPAAAPLPLVLFLVGGMEGMDPEGSRGWIEHIVRRGAVVVFPTGWLADDIGHTADQVSAALAALDRGGHAPVDLTRVAVVGQGMGGPVAAHMAAAPPAGLPAPTALMVVMPEIAPADRPATLPEDLAALPAATRVVLVGAEDAPESGADLDVAWEALTQANRILAHQRAYVVLRSDAHGTPALEASQHAVNTVGFGQPDALDWYGTWKLLDGLMGCAFDGEWCEYAFGNTPEQRYMGVWSDGVPVNEAIVVQDPATPVAISTGIEPK